MLKDGEELDFRADGQDWTIAWHPPAQPPPGTRHGSAAVCRTRGHVLLVSADQGSTWSFPGGRPEGAEDWRETLQREVREEACAEVVQASLLGYSRGVCLQGYEKGLVLVRALWVADVSLQPWEPKHEMTHRCLVPADGVLDRIPFPDGTKPLLVRWVSEALFPRAPT